ncbi:MAG: ribonuclease H-like domain-containing protein [Nitrospirae bacterium]|nr:ribonuclease H-like domain-containing protein [Nitrospirota bacterium]
MIRHTFSFLDGIGLKLERHFWRMGIISWQEFLNRNFVNGISPYKKEMADIALSTTLSALEGRDAQYFSRLLPQREQWRLFDVFGSNALCIDIETNGLPEDKGGFVTVVGLYDGYDYRSLVKGINLTEKNLKKELSSYGMIITFYGSSFDIPFLSRKFNSLIFEMPHFDLGFASKRAGLKGGLKRLEEELGIIRDESVQGMDGYDAVKLWHLYRRRSREDALERLLKYNMEDTKNLLKIAEIIYKRLKDSTGISKFISQS